MKTNALQTNASKLMAPSQGVRSRLLGDLHLGLSRSVLFASVLIFGLLCVGSYEASAQATGQISGEVTDPSGRVVPAAKIELTNPSTGDVRSIVSGPNGSYAIPLVNPGVYQVRVQVSGFRTSVTNNVQVEVNSTSRVDVKLQLGEASEQVTVTDTAPLVETGNAAMGEVVDHQQIVDLPLNGRNFAQLGTLIPGVVASPAALGGANGNATVGGFGNTTGSFNVNGMRNQSNNFLLDGAPNNDSFNSGFVMRPPPDAIEEFKIITHSYEAQYGRNAGSVVNVVTRSGTNKYHGSVWEFNREAAYAARNWFSTAASASPTTSSTSSASTSEDPSSRTSSSFPATTRAFATRTPPPTCSTCRCSAAPNAPATSPNCSPLPPERAEPWASPAAAASSIPLLARSFATTASPT